MNWKAVLAIVYAVICVFDFLVIPTWRGFNRFTYPVDEIQKLDPQVQIVVLDKLTKDHSPLTLQGGGLFHLSFGALLTGSAVTGNNKRKEEGEA